MDFSLYDNENKGIIVHKKICLFAIILSSFGKHLITNNGEFIKHIL